MNGESLSTFLGDTAVSASVAGCIIALTNYADDLAFEEWHSHEHASISLLLTGTHEEDLDGRHYKRPPGDIKFIPAGEQHRCHSYVAGTKKINIDVSPGLLDDIGLSDNTLFTQLSDHPPLSLPC